MVDFSYGNTRKLMRLQFAGLLAAAIIAVPTVVAAQTRIISGVVSDGVSGERLGKTSVYVVEKKDGTVAAPDGSYSVVVPAKGCTLRFSYVGYRNVEVKITAETDATLNISMEQAETLEELVVSTRKKDENVTSTTMGVAKLSMEEIRLLPAIMGEIDVLKTIQLLPGVQATSEISTGFSVRGGSPDQNLITLDNTTVYNPMHQLGFFSAFNNDIVSGIELYKGHFPFRHGGRLSSLLEVKTRDAAPTRVGVTGGIGLISSRLMLEGPLGDKTSWLVAGRRTYADMFLVFASDKDLRNTVLYFYDLNAKLSHRLTKNDKIELNFYKGLDRMKIAVGEFNYGNLASSLTWLRTFSKKMFGKFSAHYTAYNYRLASDMNDIDVDWRSNIRDWSFRADFHQPFSALWDVSYGATVISHSNNPGKVTMQGLGLDDYVIPENHAMEYAVYLSNEQKFADRLTVKYGLRTSVFRNSGDEAQTYTGIEPGVGAVYKLSETSSFKVNYSHNTQYMQLANNSAAGSPLDVWFSSSKNVKPQQVDMFSAGYFLNFNDNVYETSVETYYKNMNSVIDFREHSNLLLNTNLEGEIRTGTGKSYGIEFMLKKNSGKLTGFVNYTLSRTERTIPEVNNGKTYLAPYDKTHVFNAVATYNLTRKLNVSAVWVITSGMPTTYPTGRFAIGDQYFPIYSGRNEYRKPAYHRLDLSLNYIPKPDSKKRWKSEFNFSVYNAYNRRNPWTIIYRQDADTRVPYTEMLYLFGVVPSITCNFKF
jgi:hypothetical protein